MANIINGTTGNNSIQGTSDDDIIFGNGGVDAIHGGYGNDTIYGGSSTDTLWGDDGYDVIYGFAGNDFIYGGAGNDFLDGGRGVDTVSGDDGDDTLVFTVDENISNIPKDTYDGGSGSDTLVINISSSLLGQWGLTTQQIKNYFENNYQSVTHSVKFDSLKSGFKLIATNMEEILVNTIPVASNDSYSTNEDTPLVVNAASGVFANDSDADHDTLTAVLVTGPKHGSLTLNADGSFTYTPAPNYNGTDSFTYKANDGFADSNVATVSLIIRAVNDPPVAQVPATTLTVNEDTYLAFSGAKLIKIVDVDAGSGTVEVTLHVDNGTLTLSRVTGLTFLPNAGDGLTSDGKADATMTFRGTLTNVNAALNGMKYIGSPNYNGTDTLHIYTSDLGNTGGDGSPLTTCSTVNINVLAVNDAPINAVPAAQRVDEDTALVFSTANNNAISISDVDAGSGLMKVTLSVVNGTLTFSDTSGLTFVSGGNGTKTMTFTGSVNDINNALNGLTYQGKLNYAGSDTLTIITNDQGNTGIGGAKTDTDKVAITVTAVNDAPVNHVPNTSVTPITAYEDTMLIFSASKGTAVSITDVDAGTGALQVTLTVTHGTLTLNTISGLTFTTGDGIADTTMTFTGKLTAINSALNGMKYLADLNYNGPATLSITTNDQGNTGSGTPVPLSDSDTVAINVVAVNDAPVNSVPTTQTVAENSNLVFSPASGNAISISDIDITGSDTSNPSYLEQVTLSVLHGTLSVANTSGLTSLTGNNTATLVLTGTIDAINAALAGTPVLNGLTYRSAFNYSGSDTLKIVTNDQGNIGIGGAKTDTDTVAIKITVVNDAPINHVPDPQSTNEDIALVFSAAKGNAITITDADAGTSPLKVTLTVSEGSLTLNSIAGLTLLTGDGVADPTMTFTGSLNAINNALNGLTYRSDLNYNGEAILTITTDDQGFTGIGGAQQSTNTVNITVVAVNDAPVNTVPAAQSVNEDTALVFSTANGKAISISDVDANGQSEQVTLTVSHGTLTLGSNTSGLDSFTNNSATVTLTGTITAINNALDGLTYLGTPNYNGFDTLTISTNDLENTGINGAQTVNTTVQITVNSVNDAPIVATPIGDQNINGGTAFNLAVAGTFSDVDGDTLIYTATLPDGSPLPSWLQFNGSTFSGTPSNSDVGNIIVRVTASDGAASVYDEFTITVASTNAAPVAAADAYSIAEDTPLSVAAPGVLANDSDDSPSITAVLVAGPAHASSFTLHADGSFDYTPMADYNGPDSFTYRASDGVLTSAVTTVNLTVTAVNDAPVNHVPGTSVTPITVYEDGTLVFTGSNSISISDVDITGNNTSNPSYLEQVTLDVLNGTLTLSDTSVLDPSTPNGTSHLILTGTISAINTALAGLTYQGNPDFSGTDTLRIITSDLGNTGIGGALQAQDTVAIMVTPINHAPEGVDKTVNPLEGNAYIFGTADFDFTDPNDSPANSLLAVKITTLPSEGSLKLDGVSVSAGDFISATDIANGLLVFTPDVGGSNHITFTFQVKDDGGTDNGGMNLDQSANTFTIDAIPRVNDAPVSHADAYFMPANPADSGGGDGGHLGGGRGGSSGGSSGPASAVLNVAASQGVLANDTDANGDPLTILVTGLVSGPAHASDFTLNSDGSFSYTPVAGFTGTDSFTYHSNDGTQDGNDATVTIYVSAPNLFTTNSDSVDFNTVASFDFTVDYWALDGGDYVYLPDATHAASLGYNPANTFYAGDGDDFIIGRDINNIINGGNGNDSIAGGIGHDVVEGGTGADTIVLGPNLLSTDYVSPANSADLFNLTGTHVVTENSPTSDGIDAPSDFNSDNYYNDAFIGNDLASATASTLDLTDPVVLAAITEVNRADFGDVSGWTDANEFTNAALPSVRVEGNLAADNDIDLYQITLRSGETFIADVDNLSTSNGMHTVLTLYNASGMAIAFSQYGYNESGLADTGDAVNAYSPFLTYTALTSDVYYLRIESTYNHEAGDYRINMSIQPEISPVDNSVAGYEGSAYGVTIDLSTADANGIVTGQRGDAQSDQLIGVHNILGSANNDMLTGDDYANWLRGGAGDDVISGGNGNDVLDGGAGADTVDGGDGDDTLVYNLQENLNNPSPDQYYGGAGNDTLLFNTSPGVLEQLGLTNENIANYFNAHKSLGTVDFTNLNPAINLIVHGVENIQVATLNLAPVATPIPAQSNQEDTAVTFDVKPYFVDPNGDTLTFSASGLPAGLSIDSNTGIISGTLSDVLSPIQGQGHNTVSITADDGHGGSVLQIFSWNVTVTPPTALPDEINATEGSDTISGSVATNDSDPKGDTLTYALTGSPIPYGFSFNSNHEPDGSYTFDTNDPNYNSLAEGEKLDLTFVYTVTNSRGGSAESTLTIHLTGTNDAPQLTLTPILVSDDGATLSDVNVISNVYDPDHNSNFTYSASGLPDGITIDPNTGLLNGTLAHDASQAPYYDASQNPYYIVTVTVDDGSGTANSASSQNFTWYMYNPAPVAVGATFDLNQNGSAISGALAGNPPAPGNPATNDYDPDGDTFTYTHGTLPAGFSLDAAGNYSFDPSVYSYLGADESKTVTASYTLTDSQGAVSNTGEVVITVHGLNDTPEVVGQGIGTQTAKEDSAFSFAVSNAFTDVDRNDSLTYTAKLADGSNLPDWLSFDGVTFSGTPHNEDVGSISVRVTATDTSNASVFDDFTIIINGVNDFPVNSVPSDQSVDQNTDLVFSSANGNAISISDVDANGGVEKVTLTVSNGILTLSQTTGLAFLDSTMNGSATMTFEGTIDNINAALNGMIYHSDSSFTGSDTLHITTDDQGNSGSGGALTDSDSVSITVNATSSPNHAPVANNDTYYMPVGETLVIGASHGVLVNDIDADDNPLSVSVVTGPANGVLTFNSDGSFSYTPDADFTGIDSFTYTVNDGTLDSSPATVTINVAEPHLFSNGQNQVDFNTLSGFDPMLNFNFNPSVDYWALDSNDSYFFDLVRLPDADHLANDPTLLGYDPANIFYGGAGSDLIYGRDLNNLINGGAGNDRIFSGIAQDTIEGGADGDEIYITSNILSTNYVSAANSADLFNAVAKTIPENDDDVGGVASNFNSDYVDSYGVRIYLNGAYDYDSYDPDNNPSAGDDSLAGATLTFLDFIGDPNVVGATTIIERSDFGSLSGTGWTDTNEFTNPALPSVRVEGSLASANDIDLYRVELKAGETFIADLDTLANNYALDASLTLYNAAGVAVAFTEDGRYWGAIPDNGDLVNSTDTDNHIDYSYSPFLVYTALTDGYFYLRVEGAYNGDAGNYRINMSIQPETSPTDNSVVSYETSPAGVTIDLSNLTAAPGIGLAAIGQGGDAEGDQLVNAHNILGSAFNDTLIGDDYANWLRGGAGDDSISGGAGNDVLDGGAGADTVHGNAGDDTLVYNLKENLGNAQADEYFGDDGTDTLVFNASSILLSQLGLTAQNIIDYFNASKLLNPTDPVDFANLNPNINLVVHDVEHIEVVNPSAANLPPVGAIPNQSDVDTASISFDVSSYFSDPNGDSLSFSASGLPTGLSISSAGLISGTFDSNDALSGPYSVVITASDGNGGATHASFQWTVTALPPVVQGDPPVNATEGGAVVTGDVSTNDSDPYGGTLTYALVDPQNAPAGLTFNSDGSFSFDPTSSVYDPLNEGDLDPLVVTYTVTNSHGGSAQATLTINLVGVNDAPTLTLSTDSLSSDDSEVIYENLIADVTDLDAHHFTFSANSALQAMGLNINPTTGVITGILNSSASQGSPYLVTIFVDDGTGTATSIGSQSFYWYVNNPAPVITNATDSFSVAENDPIYSGTLAGNAYDPDHDTLFFSSDTLPAGFVLNSNGTYTFDASNPAYDASPSGTFQMLYTVTDADGTTAPGFATLTINFTGGVNDAPRFTAIDPQTSQDGAAVSLNILSYVRDPDPDDHISSFSATGLPDGLEINPENGFISGILTNTDSASSPYTVTIYATDNHGATSSQSFTWTITNPAPVAADDPDVVATQGTGVMGGSVAGNDSDPDNDALSFAVNGPAPAGFSMDSDGSYTLDTSDPAYTYLSASDTLDIVVPYTVTDAQGATDTATLTITMTGVNDAPVITQIGPQSSHDGQSINFDAAPYFTDPEHDRMTFSADNLPGGLSIDQNTGIISGVLNHDDSQNNLYYVGITVDDGNGGINTQYFSWTVANPAPVATDATVDVNEESVLIGNLTDYVSDDDTLTFTLDEAAPAGFTLNADGSYTFDAFNPTYAGLTAGQTTDVAISYTVTDAQGATDSATLTITVTGVNSAPVVVNGIADQSIEEDTPFDFIIPMDAFNDPDSSSWTYTSYSAVLSDNSVFNGFSLDPSGTFSGTPPLNYNGDITITVTASDGERSVDSTFTLTVTPVNDAPDDADEVLSTPEDTPLSGNVLANPTDIDGDTLSITQFVVNNITYSVGQTANLVGVGTLMIDANGDFTFTPTLNFNGAVPVAMYTVSDDHGGTDTSTLTITVTPANDAPDDADEVLSTPEDTPLSGNVLANPTDIDGDALSITQFVVNSATYSAGQTANLAGVGTLMIDANGDFTFNPALDFNGAVPVAIYTVSDDHGGTDTSTLTISVTPVNDAPVAVADSYLDFIVEDTPVGLVAIEGVLSNDFDVDSSSLSAILVSQAVHGTVSLNADGSFSYTPDANFWGTDTFTYKVNDGSADSNVATVTLYVHPVNDGPAVGNPDSYTMDEDSVLTINATNGVLANDTDPDNDPLTASLLDEPRYGTLTFNSDGSFIYTPNANFFGTDSFTYIPSDGGITTSSATTVTITVNNVPDAPVAVDDSYSVDEDTPLSISALSLSVLHNDLNIDGNPLTAVLASGPAHAQLFSLNTDGTFSYIPTANFFGTDSFTYKTNDGTLNSNTATVTITVNNVPDAPVAVDDSYTINEDTTSTFAVLANDNDPDNFNNPNYDPLTVILAHDVAHGSLTLNADGSFTYTPDANYNGFDSFSYLLRDSTGLISNSASVNITVTAVNDAPLAVADNYSMAKGTTLSIPASGVLANDTDVEGSLLTAILVTGPAHGSLSLNANGSFTYTPDANFNGTDSFTYKANDGTVDGNTATVNIIVNAAPVASNDVYSTDEDTALTVPTQGVNGVLVNDNDADSNPLTAILVSGPAHGILNLNANGSFTYTPDANFNGTDSFTYKANDGAADSNTATVTITVNPVNDAPVANNDSYTVISTPDETLSAQAIAGVLANDTDVDGDHLTATLVDDVAHGSLVFNSDGSFTYTPETNYAGDDSFTYKVNDGTVDGNIATVTITVLTHSDYFTSGDDVVNFNTDVTGTISAVDYQALGGNDTVTLPDAAQAAVIGYDPANTFYGGAGNDTIIGGNLNDIIDGDAGDDIIFGGAGNDILQGDIGNDILDGGPGNDIIDGGPGNDTVSYKTVVGSALVVNLSDVNPDGSVTAHLTSGEFDTLFSIENIIGTDFADIITGDDGDNVLEGGLGGDLIDGRGGHNTASYANASSGVYAVLDGIGLSGEADGDQLTHIQDLIGSASNDTLVGNNDANALYGGGGNDTLIGGAGDDALYGGDGDDTLDGGLGADYLDGGAGVNTATYANAPSTGVILDPDTQLPTGFTGVTVDLTDNDNNAGGDAEGDKLYNIQNIIGSAFNDTLIGDAGNNILYGGNGDDDLQGNAGDDVLYGENGNDTLSGGDGNDTLYGGFGNDILHGGDGNDTLYGNENDDILEGGAGADTLDGGAGVNTATYANAPSTGVILDPDTQLPTGFTGVTVNLTTGTGSGGDAEGDILINIRDVIGSAFNDTIIGDSQDNTFYGGAGDDILNGGAGNDTLYGGDGNDTLIGGAGIDLLYGEAGDDTFEGNAGSNFFYGGSGFNTVTYAWATSSVSVSLLAGTGTHDVSFTDTFTDIQAVIGSSHDDFLDGSNNADTLSGGAGNDTLQGRGGDDTLYGDDGDDLLEGGAGADLLDGGAGTNTATYISSTAGVTVDLTDNDNNAGGDAEGDKLYNIQNIIGSDFNDHITGDSVANVLDGGFGDDIIHGGAGNDTLYGGVGNDTLYGDAGDDLFIDGIGSNYYYGGDGFDTVSYASSDSSVNVNLSTGIAVHNTNIVDTLDSIEQVIGSNFNDTLVGSDGNDYLYGGFGSDILEGGKGADTLDGGDPAYGLNTATYAHSDSGVTVDLSNNANNAGGDAQGDQLFNIQIVIGSNYNDTLIGNTTASTLDGGAGDDKLIGKSINGGDVLTGGSGNDLLQVNDTTGSNTLTGGTGADTFKFINYAANNTSSDTITDFRLSEGDILNLASYGIIASNFGNYITQSFDNGSTVLHIAGTSTTITLLGVTSTATSSWFTSVLNNAPVAVADSYSTDEDTALTVTASGVLANDSDADGDLLTAALVSGPAHASSFTLNDNGSFSYTPTANYNGSDSFTYRAYDGTTYGNTVTVSLTVTAVNDAPTIANSIVDQNATKGTAFSFIVSSNTFADIDTGDTLTYSATLADGSALPNWLVFDNVTREFSGTPTNGDSSIVVRVTATDSANASVYDDFSIAINTAPTVVNAIDTQNALEDSAFSFIVPSNTFADADAGDSLTYSATLADGSALPSWLVFDNVTREFSGTPAHTDIGNITVRVIATDTVNASVYDDFTLSIARINHAPTDSGETVTIYENETINDNVLTNADDVDGDALTVTQFVVNGITYLTNSDLADHTVAMDGVGTLVINADGSYTFEPALDFHGSVPVTSYTVSDGYGGTTISTLAITVSDNTAPTVRGSIADSQVTTGNLFQVDLSQHFGDAEQAATSLTYTATLADGSALPNWLSVESLAIKGTSIPVLTGTPGATDIGDLQIVVTATDRGGLSASSSFLLSIEAPHLFTDGDDGSSDAPVDFNAIDPNVFNPATAYDALAGNDYVMLPDAAHAATLGYDPANTFYGGDGNDTIIGRDLNDIINGGAGDDMLIGGAGADTLDGGTGNNTASYEHSSAAVTVDLSTGIGSGGDAEGDTLTNIQNLRGSDNNDTLIGITGSMLEGGAGADTLRGTVGATNVTASYEHSSAAVTVDLSTGSVSGGDAQDDQLYNIQNIRGSDNNDILTGITGSVLEGGAGTDTLSGAVGATNVTVSYEHSSAAVTIDLSTGSVSGGDAQGDQLYNIQNLRGSAYNDTLIGITGSVLEGGAGADTLSGAAGATDVTVSYEHSSAAVTVDLSTGSTSGGDAQGDQLYNIQNLRGSAYDDLFIANSAANSFDGGAGSNTVSYQDSDEAVIIDLSTRNASGGYAAGDTLTNIQNLRGSAYGDTLIGITGSVLEGGAGADVLIGVAGATNVTASYEHSSAAVTVDLSTGSVSGGDAAGDTLTNIQNLRGSAYDDTLIGITGSVLEGGAGADVLSGVAGATNVIASYEHSSAAVTVDLSTGSVSGGDAAGDTLTNIQNLRGSAYDDILVGIAGSVLEGGAGADTLIGTAGDVTASYEHSSAAVTINLSTGIVSGGDAAGDTLTNIRDFIGSSFDDVFVGTTGNNSFDGGDGSDTISYAHLSEGVTVDLSAKNFDGSVTVTTGSGEVDTLRNIDNVVGTDFDDVLIGNAGDNVLSGGEGNDFLMGGAGHDIIDGGADSDTVSYAYLNHGVMVNLNATQTDGSVLVSNSFSDLDTLRNIESVIGTDFNDQLAGDAGDNVLSGGDGNDFFVGFGGNDILDGGNGSDTDTVFYNYITTDLTVDLSTTNLLDGSVTVTAGLGDVDTLRSIENIVGGSGANTLIGDANNNKLVGGNSDDTLVGNDGNDSLAGQGGNDTLDGGASDDALNGGTGSNTLTGGTGADIFTFDADQFNDVVTDFTPSNDNTGDKLDLSAFGVNADDFSALTATQNGNDTVLTITAESADPQHIITLQNTTATDINGSWFTAA